MKKLLTILGAVGLTATGTTSAVVSCGTTSSVTDLSKFDGKLAGAAKAGDAKNGLVVTYGTVANLKAAIKFQLGLTDEDLTSDGIIIKVANKADAADKDKTEAPLGDLKPDKFYFASMEAKEDSKNAKGKIENAAIDTSDKKFDISKASFRINSNLAATTATAVTNANAAMFANMKSTMGVTDAVFDATFGTTTPGFTTAETAKLTKDGVKSAVDKKALDGSKTFKGTVSKDNIVVNFQFPLSMLSNVTTFAVPAQNNWETSGSNEVLTDAGAKYVNNYIANAFVKEIQAQVKSGDSITFEAADLDITAVAAGTQAPGTPATLANVSIASSGDRAKYLSGDARSDLTYIFTKGN